MPISEIPVTYRTTDMARWGTGKGSNLTPTEVDENFWELVSIIIDLADNPTAPAEIDSITVTDGTFTILLTDGRSFGPFALPIAGFHYEGEWVGGTSYTALSIFTVTDVGTFLAQRAYEAPTEFDPLEEDGFGVILVQLAGPGAAGAAGATGPGVPNGGTTGQVLTKVSDDDQDTDWVTPETSSDPAEAPYDLGFQFGGVPGVSEAQNFIAVRAWSLPASATLSKAAALVASTGTAVIDIQKNGSSVGSITFTTDDAGTFTVATQVDFAAGDVLSLVAPASPDATLADIFLTLAGFR